MHAQRPAKITIRELWVKVVRDRKDQLPLSVPFYLTLPGAAGLDLELLIREGLIEQTETGAISDADNKRVIAVEKDSLAVLELQRKFPGLKIIERDIYDDLRGTSQIVFPEGRNRAIFTAGVINLDLNGPLLFKNESFPIIEAVVKIATLQAAVDSRHDWTLLLTTQGEITWPTEIQLEAQQFVTEQCALYSEFQSGCKRILGDSLYEQLTSGKPLVMNTQATTDQQNLILAFLPAKLMVRLYSAGWRIDVVHCIRYGGEPGVAPMTTWILNFQWDSRAASTPNQVLVAAMQNVLDRVSYVTSDGDLVDV